ncbi:Gfo/Idh/MocA family oxidoreductase [Novosphingobium sp. PS1R-30]|uniref:Gfo/Idh/MocA family oxidoreductase n=1 Tax=Novosphingobium anseongense TaxID=3133436 RepID=A0ABU8RX91_9SPHN
MTAPIPALVVGTGFGCRIHVPALRATGFEVVGLVGNTPEKLAKRAAQNGIARHFTDLDEAIAATGAKVVTIATPPSTHAALTLKAIAHGCHVVCEKPFAADAIEGQAMLDAAEQAGVFHMVAHEFRWLPDRALFGRAIAEGLIGDPRFLVMDQFIPFCADPETPLPKWWFDKASGGGWLGAGGSHLMDQIRAWLGEFEDVSANLFLTSDRQADAEDSYSMRFRMKNGVEGSMQQTAGAWGPSATLWRCAGTKGTVWIEAGKVFVADKSGTRELAVTPDLELPPAPPAEEGARRMSHFEIGPFTRLCEALHAGIEGKPSGSPVPVPTFRDGLASMQILDAMRASSDKGGAITKVG